MSSSNGRPAAIASPNPGRTPFSSPAVYSNVPSVSLSNLSLTASAMSASEGTSTATLLERVRHFLPKIQKANELLGDQDRMELPLEDAESRAIDMDLMVGVFDAQPDVQPDHVARATDALLGRSSLKPHPGIEEVEVPAGP